MTEGWCWDGAHVGCRSERESGVSSSQEAGWAECWDDLGAAVGQAAWETKRSQATQETTEETKAVGYCRARWWWWYSIGCGHEWSVLQGKVWGQGFPKGITSSSHWMFNSNALLALQPKKVCPAPVEETANDPAGLELLLMDKQDGQRQESTNHQVLLTKLARGNWVACYSMASFFSLGNIVCHYNSSYYWSSFLCW